MKFAIIGDDPAALHLVRAIIESHDDQLIAAALLSLDLQHRIQELSPATQMTNGWDQLLVDEAIDGVIVSGAGSEVLDAAKQFASSGKPLILVPSASQGSAFLYELALIRDDTGVLLFPVLMNRTLPAVQSLKEVIASDRLGTIRIIEIDRELHVDSMRGGLPLLASTSIDETLLPDVELLRYLGGEYDQVTAMHAAAGTDGIVTASVTLGGENRPEASWSMKGSPSRSSWRLKAIGDRGTATLVCEDDDNSRIQMELSGDQTTPPPTKTQQPSSQDGATWRAMLHRFKETCRSEESSRDWSELVRAFETVEATHRSIRRRRTIDLHFESTSERSQFKTQMTAIGCGVLTFTLFAVVALLIATTVLDLRDKEQIDADRAGAIVSITDFESDSATLKPETLDRLKTLGPRMAAGRFPVLVEQQAESPALDEPRRIAVVAALEASGVAHADQRTTSTVIEGKWFSSFLRIARVVIFLPLFLFLLLQFLLVIARPASP